MYLNNYLIFILLIFTIKQYDCLDGSFLNNLGNLIPKLIEKKEELKKEETASWSKNQTNSIKKDENDWSISKLNLFKENKLPNKIEPKSSWFPNLKVLNFIPSKEYDQSSDASKNKTNLTNYWDLFNFNFSSNNTNWKLEMPKLEFNSTYLFYKDWFVSTKTKQYDNLLNNKTELNNIEITTIKSTNLIETNSTSYMNFTIFRERLIKVYDNLAFCEHPCTGKRTMKNNRQQILINGCGPSYFSERQLKMIPYGEYFKDCCNNHDLVYAECGYHKQKADYDFLDCMLQKINRTSIEDKNIYPRVRKSFSYALFGMVDFFGCKAYELSQKEVCLCN